MQRDDQRDLEAQQEHLLSGGAAACYGSTDRIPQPRVLRPEEEAKELNEVKETFNDYRHRLDEAANSKQNFLAGIAVICFILFVNQSLNEDVKSLPYTPGQIAAKDILLISYIFLGLTCITFSTKCGRSTSFYKSLIEPVINRFWGVTPIQTAVIEELAAVPPYAQIGNPHPSNPYRVQSQLDAKEEIDLREQERTIAARMLLIPNRSSSSSSSSSTSVSSSSSALFSSSSSSLTSSRAIDDPFSELREQLPHDVLTIIDEYLASRTLAPGETSFTKPAKR